MNEGLAGQGIELIEQVILALQQGVTPQELIEAGIPQQIVEMALEKMSGAGAMETEMVNTARYMPDTSGAQFAV